MDFDAAILETIKGLKSGDAVSLNCTELDGRRTLNTIRKWQAKSGEDEPGVFVFQKTAMQKVNNQEVTSFRVTKLLDSATILVPPAREPAGKGLIQPTLASQVYKFHEGDLVMLQVEQAGGQTVLKNIQPYVAPLKADFVKFIQKKPGDGNYAFIQIKSADGDENVNLSNIGTAGQLAPDRALVAAASSIKPDQKIEYRVVKDDKGTWLTSLRVAPAEAKSDVVKADITAKATK